MTWRSFISPESSSQKPNVAEYLNVFEFLKDYYLYRKKIDSKFSYEKWSVELNIKGRSLLRLILSGRRNITDSFIDLFCQQLFEESWQREYFCNLVLYSQSKSKEERKSAGKKLTSLLRRHVETKTISESKSFLGTTLIPRLFSLLDQDHIKKDPESLAKIFSVSIHEIEQALNVLLELKLIDERDGQYLAQPGAFSVPSKIGNKELLNYHANALKDAIQAQNMAIELRRYRSSVALLDAKQWQEFLARLDQFINEFMEKGNAKTTRVQRLYQLNINIHSVSEEISASNSIEEVAI